MSRVTMVHHINVQTSDRERTREWYEKVLGAKFRDRGPELNRRQLQLIIGNAEMHYSETTEPIIAPRVHFAVEVDNWDEMLAHLDALGVEYSRTAGGGFSSNIGGKDPYQGNREDSGEHYTYIHDPDGNLIELVYHPLGLEDLDGNKAEVVRHSEGFSWTQIPGFVDAEREKG